MIIKKCFCGCGKEVVQNNKYYISKFIHGHNNKGRKKTKEELNSSFLRISVGGVQS